MTIDFRRERVNFDRSQGIIQNETVRVSFDSRVRSAEVAINGFDIEYTNGDHHILRQIIDTAASISRNNNREVTVDVAFLLRDNSGNIDDPYEGFVDVLVIVDRV